MKILLSILLLFAHCASAQICNPNGNIVIFSNYDGGILNINVDMNIPNLKIGIVSYEAVEVNLSGTYAGNVTAIEYAGYNNSPNTHCGNSIATTAFTGVPIGVTPNIEFVPPAPFNDPDGYLYIDCAYSCGTGNMGGCNTPEQVYAYFENLFSGTVYTHIIQYGCWTNTQNLSDGGNCCMALAAAPVANFSVSNNMICLGECIDFTDLSTNTPTSWNWDFTGNGTMTSTLQNPTNICYSAPGTYMVTLITGNATGNDTISIPLNVIEVNSAYTINGITLTASAPNATYQWINCANNSPIAGATSASYTPTANGSYAVIVSQNGCSDTSGCAAISTVDINQMTAADVMAVFPNPSKGIFVLYDQQSLLADQLITVSNLMGETIYSTRIISDKTSLDLSNMKNGIYFITVDSQLGKYVTKIVKE